MERVGLISEEVEKTREAARRKADEERRRLVSEYSVRGLGRSGPLLKALLDNDIGVVEAILQTRVDAEDRYAPRGSSQEQMVATEGALNDLRSIVEAEMTWLEARARGEAERMGLGGRLGNSISTERERLSAVYERELRLRAGRRQREGESIPYFPDGLMRFHETGKFHVLETADAATDEDVQALCELLYDFPERDVYLFVLQGAAPSKAFAAANENGAIVVAETQDYFYKHPRYELNYIRIPPGTARRDWERELAKSGSEFRRLRLKLSERERVRMAVAEAAKPLDFSGAKPALWILESPEINGEIYQGSAFALAGVGLVTCQHVLHPGTAAFQPESLTKRQVKIAAEHAGVDLAVLEIEGDVPMALEASPRNGSEGDDVAALGFPNYRPGDTGIVHWGRVSGMRPVSGIRRLLLTAGIVKGMSGGPVLDASGKVIAVTGADRMDQTRETEDQSAIPIDALRYLKLRT